MKKIIRVFNFLMVDKASGDLIKDIQDNKVKSVAFKIDVRKFIGDEDLRNKLASSAFYQLFLRDPIIEKLFEDRILKLEKKK